MDIDTPTLYTAVSAPAVDSVEVIARTLQQLNQVILGKERQIRQCLACLLARVMSLR